MNYSEYSEAYEALQDAQDVESDNREQVREAHLFISKRNGQWEQYWWDAREDQPRYTFDLTSPVVDLIAGEIAKSDFSIKVDPAGGESSEDTAQVLDGLIRNIENISNATHIYNTAARAVVTSGLCGWRVTTDFIDDVSFDQDLIIKPISNYHDRVWFDQGSTNQNRSDAKWCVQLHAPLKSEYEERWPEGSCQSVSQNKNGQAYYYSPDVIIVGEFLYKKEETIDVVLMSNGKVYEDNEDFKAVMDELAQAGVTEKDRRKRKKSKVYSRFFDGSGWLDEEKATPFKSLPIIEVIANYSVFDNKIIYYGAVEKQMDWQRVFNYAKSREIQEGAMAPNQFFWATDKQITGNEDQVEAMNIDGRPVRIYTPDPEAPGAPVLAGGAQINPGLQTLSAFMQEGMTRAAGFVSANLGAQVNDQSGVAIKALQNKGDIGTIKYFDAMEIAICQTGKVLIEAIPSVYDAERKQRILGEDGTSKMVVLNESIIDEQTGNVITLNDLTQGKYDVTCSSGPTFQNRQQETQQAIMEMASIDPTILDYGKDVMLRNTLAPGMDIIADRVRAKMLESGMIRPDEMTDEEKQQIQAMQQQPQQPDAMMVAAQAEVQKAEAEMASVQLDMQKAQIDIQERAAKLDIERQRLTLQAEKQQLELLKAQQSANLDQQKFDFDSFMKTQKQQNDLITQVLTDNKIQADTLKTIREAMGIDSIVGPSNTKAYVEQADKLEDSLDG